MQIDTTNATITFKSGEKVHPINLRSAADAVGTHMTIFVDLELPQWELDLITPFTPRVTEVESFSKTGVKYVVIEIRKDLFTCSCPDFTKRRVKNGEHCKHISSIVYFR
jgi:hypothetical protein